MTPREFREAQQVFKRMEELVDLRREVAERDVDFCEGDRRRGLGRMQLDPSLNERLKEHIKAAALQWFDDQISECKTELAKLGIVDEAA